MAVGPRDRRPAVVGFGPPASPVRVAVEVPAAVPLVDALFPDDRSGPAGGAPDLALRLRDGGYEIAGCEGGEWTARDLPAIVARLELVVAERLARTSPGIGVHAAGVATGREGATLLVGPGGSGKSSLTAGLARQGFAVLGDDVIFLRRGEAHPFRRLLKVEEPARTILGLPAARGSLAGVWPGAAFYHPADLGSSWSGACRVDRVVLLERTSAPGARLEDVGTGEALARLLSGLVLAPRVEDPAFDAVAAALEGARCHRLRYGESPAAVEVLVEATAA